MSHDTNVSVAYVVVSVAGAFGGATKGRLSAGVLSRAPGDGATGIARDMAAALRMEVLEIRMPNVEYHPGALDTCVYAPFERAVATGRPVMLILDEAQGAEGGVVEAVMSAVAKRVEDQPCAVLAITTTAGEARVAARMAEGLDVDVGRIVMHRTDEENARLVERVAAANR